MRKFSSYGPVDRDIHYHAPRKTLIEEGCRQLVGDNPEKGGHYITVWAPRQAGKTWIMQQVARNIRERGDFEVAIITMQSAKEETTDAGVLDVFVSSLGEWFGRPLPEVDSWRNLAGLFSGEHFERPLILIIDEFDALREDFINKFANQFRDVHIKRQNEPDRPSDEIGCRLHGLALIGVRSVLGIENVSGSPFNVQRSLRIPNLTHDEVSGMFAWYQRESGQQIDPDVVERLFYETQGQPGLSCWFGELLTEGFEEYRPDPGRPVTAEDFEEVFAAAVDVLPNNNILNVISKARQEPHREMMLELFRTDKKIRFRYDDPSVSFLYMNGVIDRERAGRTAHHVRFASPFVQRRLFNCFAGDLVGHTGKLHEPFEDMSDTLTEKTLDITNLIRRFETYLRENRDWLLNDAPRRKDMRVREAVYHFALYRYVSDFMGTGHARVWPEFPTGNGKVDMLIRYAGQTYAMELKSWTNEIGYGEALAQAARYGKQLGLPEIALVFFVEQIPDEYREKYETDHTDADTGVRVRPVFAETGI